ncbi:MAG: hypothetical protein ACRELY_27595 [Polyangiaceae bacterium]
MLKSGHVLFCALALAACGGDQAKPNAAPAPSASSADDQALAQLAADAGLDELIISDAGTTAPTGPQITTDAGLVKSSGITADNSNDECGGHSAKFEGIVRAKFNDCYQEGKKKNPDLAGEIRITVNVDYKGKITSIKNTGGKDLGDKVIACMMNAVKKTPFEGVETCKSKAIIVGKKYGQ